MIEKLERGQSKPTETQIALIERVLGVPLVKRQPSQRRRI